MDEVKCREHLMEAAQILREMLEATQRLDALCTNIAEYMAKANKEGQDGRLDLSDSK